MKNQKNLEPLTDTVIIDDEKMLVKKHYEYIITYAPTPEELDDVLLKLSKFPYEPDTLYRVLLMSDDYYTFANPGNDFLEFKCNVEIVGVEKYYDTNGIPKYRFKEAMISYVGSLPANSDDFILSSKHFGELYFSHISYDIITDSFVTKKNDGSTDMVFMLKACDGNCLTVQNCKFYDNNHGRLTNIDVRDVDFIDISSNVLSSQVIVDPSVEEVNEGGNIWIRGGFKECSIVGNTLDHTGIDEMIGILGGSEYNAETIFLSNLTIANNTLNYGNYKTTMPSHKAISVVPGASKKHPNRKNYIDHVYIGDNKINCLSPCYHVICLDALSAVAEYNDVKIVGNTITRQNYETDHVETDIFVGYGTLPSGSKTVDYVLPPVEIINNQIVAMNNHSTDHYYIVRSNGAIVNVSGNIFDVTKYNSNVTGGVENSLLKLDGNGGEISFENNVMRGIDCLGTVSESGGVLDSQIRFIGNRIEYKYGFYCNNAKSIDLVMEDNYMQASGNILISQRFAKNGSISIKNNVWYNAPNQYGKMEYWLIFFNENEDMSGYFLDSLIIVDNHFKGTSTIKQLLMNKLLDADCKIFSGNVINPVNQTF